MKSNMSMKNKPISPHVQRSLLCLDMLRAKTELSASRIDYVIRYDVYGALNLLGHAPKPETVKAYFQGKRGIPVDPPGRNVPSWLMAAEMCFEGASRYFFHPLINLFSGPVESSEKAQGRFLVYPESWIRCAERYGDSKFVEEATVTNTTLMNRERVRRKPNHQGDPLKWIHACMFGLESKARDVLMVRPGLVGTWRRSFSPIEQDLSELEKIGGLEGLAGAFALFLEGAEIGDFHRLESAKQSIMRLMPLLDTTPALRRVGKIFRYHIENQIETYCLRCYAPMDLTFAPYPITWQVMLQGLSYRRKLQSVLK